MTRTTATIALALTSLALACAGGVTLPRSVPDDVENPILLTVRGGTPPEIVEVITQSMAGINIPLDIVDRTAGEARSRWIDVGDYIRTIREAYQNPQERLVRYYFDVHETNRPRERRVEIFAAYRPFRGGVRDRAVPRQHPGMQLAVRIRDRLTFGLIEAAMEVPREAEDEDTDGDGSADGGTS